MSSAKLNKDLCNCLINFDKRVLITELLDDYQLPYEEVDKILLNYLAEQEKKKLKFEKCYLVHGLDKSEHKKEIYKVVEETKLEEWLNKLHNAESSLYSVEVAGGAKSAAPIFKPMKVLECLKSNRGQESKPTTNGEPVSTTTMVEKKEGKLKPNADKKSKETTKELQQKSTSKIEISVKKTSPKTETTPPEKKVIDKKTVQKKSINNFFGPSTSKSKKSDEKKVVTSVSKPLASKNMQDFFKKQSEKPINKEILKEPSANTSVQLFVEEEEPEAESSDEEEKLDALKRDIISSDVEMEEENESEQTNSKRRRILDSEDEEENPPVKQEKLDINEETKEEEAVAETYLDEEGFVITKKPKQKALYTNSKSSSAKNTSPKKNQKLSSDSKNLTKDSANTKAKTKQAGIMNFFSKK